MLRPAGHVVPGDVHDPPSRSLDRGEPRPVSLPRQARTVMLEAVALTRDEHGGPREVEPIAADGVLARRSREPARAQQTSQSDLEARLPGAFPGRLAGGQPSHSNRTRTAFT